jgi:phospholipase/lecithinase/hemolysin
MQRNIIANGILLSKQLGTEYRATFLYIGFKEAAEGCCGSRVVDAAIFIKNHRACPNVQDYIFWDSFHATEKAYNIVVDKLFQQNIQDLM